MVVHHKGKERKEKKRKEKKTTLDSPKNFCHARPVT